MVSGRKASTSARHTQTSRQGKQRRYTHIALSRRSLLFDGLIALKDLLPRLIPFSHSLLSR